MQPFKFGIKSIAAKTALKYNIELVMFGEPYYEYGSENENSNQVLHMMLSWLLNDSEDIFFGGTHYKDILKKYQWIKKMN